MKKINNYGYILVETLLVTMFVAGVLIFLFIQFSNLTNSYDESFKYNTVENLYALQDIKEYFESDTSKMDDINGTFDNSYYGSIIYNLDEYQDTSDYFINLLKLEQIETLIITTKLFNVEDIVSNNLYSDEELIKFIKKIEASKNLTEGTQHYRLIAKFKDSFGNETYATLRFGEKDE